MLIILCHHTPMPHRFDPPPQRVCLLRLSAIGDSCHAAAALRALKQAWPQTRFTWIIGKLEAKLMTAILPGVEFITFDKQATARELLRIKRALGSRQFDLLVDLQLSLRASLVSTLVDADTKLGFDRARARELQWLFTNAQIAPATSEHVLDSFMGFVRALSIAPEAPAWDIELPDSARAYADRLIPDDQPTLVISPCSSHPARNWPVARYAEIATQATRRHDMRIILAGGHSALEKRVGCEIESAAPAVKMINQIGKDTLPELLGLLARSTVLLSPDSGPVHMATMVDTPVIGLYATTRVARSGPYYSRQWCVDRYEQASRLAYGKPATELAWARKIERPGIMELIEVAAVMEKLDALMARRK